MTARELELFAHQREFLDAVAGRPAPLRACLYYKTGAGKTLTSMLGMQALGQREVLVIAPPSTHVQWEKLADELGMEVEVMSHAKFRMRTTKLSRSKAVVADEFHLFGGHGGQGWKKLDALAKHLQAPLILASATPNYNDAERVYCVSHILDPHNTKGGYLQFLYQHCVTEQNPFALEPNVVGFKDHPDAASFLASLPGVYHLPDDAVFDIEDLPYAAPLPPEFDDLGYDGRRHRIMASQMEQRQTRRLHSATTEDGLLRDEVMDLLRPLLGGPLLVFSDRSMIAGAASLTLEREGVPHRLLNGAVPKNVKDMVLDGFRSGAFPVLIGTATLATGTDGLDKVCDTLVILDDTDDDALRRQLIGRILPRGADDGTAVKRIVRLQPVNYS
jgi:superfamily II DNA or RNA helicase